MWPVPWDNCCPRAQPLANHWRCLLEYYQNLDALNWYLWTTEWKLRMFCCKNFWRPYDVFLETCSLCNKTAHRARDTIELLRRSTPDFIAPDMWPPKSPDLNPVDYAIWSVMYSRVCIRPESMTSTSRDSVLSPCGVDWNSALCCLTPLISGNVVC